jgi:hypothetical protein
MITPTAVEISLILSGGVAAGASSPMNPAAPGSYRQRQRRKQHQVLEAHRSSP